MNSKSHLYISLIKSIIRIIACFILLWCGKDNDPIRLFAFLFSTAELLGIAEELLDKR